jgi:hypothetical protein
VEPLVNGEPGAVEENVDHVPDTRVVLGAGVVGDDIDVSGFLDHALGQKEARNELFVMTGCPHRDGDTLAAKANFQGFFDG